MKNYYFCIVELKSTREDWKRYGRPAIRNRHPDRRIEECTVTDVDKHI